MLPSFAGTTVSVIRAGRVVDHGTVAMDWSTATTVPVAGCLFQPATGADDVLHRDGVGGPAQVFMPPATDVTGLDRIVISGRTYEIVGLPHVWIGATARTSHIVANLHVWEG